MAAAQLEKAEGLLSDLEKEVTCWNRPTTWEVAGPILQKEVIQRLVEVRHILHAMAELEEVQSTHAGDCPFGVR